MKIILVSEERLDELVDTMLLKLRDPSGRHAVDKKAGVDSDATVGYRTVHYHVHELKRMIKEEPLR